MGMDGRLMLEQNIPRPVRAALLAPQQTARVDAAEVAVLAESLLGAAWHLQAGLAEGRV